MKVLLLITGVKVMVQENFENIQELKSAAPSVLNNMEFLQFPLRIHFSSMSACSLYCHIYED